MSPIILEAHDLTKKYRHAFVLIMGENRQV